MKKLSIVFAVLFMSVNFISCEKSSMEDEELQKELKALEKDEIKVSDV